jgi:hypothetical protein
MCIWCSRVGNFYKLWSTREINNCTHWGILEILGLGGFWISCEDVGDVSMHIYIIEPVSLCLWVVLDIYLAMCLPNCCHGNIITKYCKTFQKNSWIKWATMCRTDSHGEGQVHWEKRPIGQPSSCRCLSKLKNYFANYFDVFMQGNSLT